MRGRTNRRVQMRKKSKKRKKLVGGATLMKQGRCSSNPGVLGHAFEKRVRYALERNSYVLIKMNQWCKNYAPEKDNATKREYDLVMFNTRDKQFYIIECKAHYTENKLVRLIQVKEFCYKLNNYDGKHAKKMMVTDTDFTIPAKRYASKNDILLVNGAELRQMEQAHVRISRIVANKIITTNLERIIHKIIRGVLT